MKQLMLGAAVFLVATVVCIGHITARTEIRATDEVCALIKENYFRASDPDVRKFLGRCETDSIPFVFSRAHAIQDINNRLAQIQSSHLSLYTPDENRRLWTNAGTDTGLRSRMIDGELVVTSTLKNSPAERAELRAGDVVISINEVPVGSADEAQSTAGSYKIARGEKFFLADLKLEDLEEDLRPRLATVANGAWPTARRQETAVLTIPSFLPQYFEDDSWAQIIEKVESARYAIVDLRGNPGGSFPAMTRALSFFRCERDYVGTLWRTPKAGDGPAAELPNELDASRQLELLRSASQIQLKTFTADDGQKRLPCFRGDAVVLIDNGTSSVSEIFAKAMIERPRTRVWGWPTAGQVVMARWFSIGSLGGGDYAMSIPVAGYRAQDGDELEHHGVRPSRELHYELEAALRGEDSWINEASKSLKR